jgi:16S rRNA (cytosine967-C5)-methyltransferase
LSVTPARVAALRILRATRRGELADHATDRAARALETGDRAWLQELVYGTLRLRGRLDHLLGLRVHRGLESLEPDVLDVLRLGAYQLIEMGSVPDHAAVFQSVELAREVGGAGAVGLVNGVLRGLARSGGAAPDFDADPAKYLETWGSHPRWLVDRWIGRWGIEAARAIVERNNQRPRLFLRLFRIETARAIDLLGAAGVGAEPVEGLDSVVALVPGADPAAALALVPAVVQDPAAGMVVGHAALCGQGVVADLCAAPGGKAVALADEAKGGSGVVVAGDRSLRRMKLLRANSARMPGLPLLAIVADARRPAIARADGILLDVPCTGTGTLGRHPDARWRITVEDLASLAALQREILEGAARIVRPGGLLVYATCSLEEEENEAQVESFLDAHAEFQLEPGPAARAMRDARGYLMVTPHQHGFDGAFAARMRRKR